MPRKSGRPAGASKQYVAVADELSRRIAAHEWKLSSILPSRRQLARDLNVGERTVRQALTVLKVRGLVHASSTGKLTVVSGAAFESIFDGAIAVVVTTDLWSVQNDIHGVGAIWKGVLECTKDTNWSIVVLQDYRWRKEFPIGLSIMPLKGILLIAGMFSRPLLAQYADLKTPVVLLDQPALGASVHSVSVASFESAKDATQRVIRSGHRRIAFVRPYLSGRGIYTIDPDAVNRTNGFLDACKEAGMNSADYRVFTAGFTQRGTPSLREILQVSPRYTAAITTNSLFASDLAKVARAHGVSVPNDLSIVSYRSGAIEQPDWTGPQIDFTAFGRAGVDLLLKTPSIIQESAILPVWHEGTTLRYLR
jgi:DNA-binding LacI/PurR family transcriptional regulator